MMFSCLFGLCVTDGFGALEVEHEFWIFLSDRQVNFPREIRF